MPAGQPEEGAGPAATQSRRRGDAWTWTGSLAGRKVRPVPPRQNKVAGIGSAQEEGKGEQKQLVLMDINIYQVLKTKKIRFFVVKEE